MFSLYNKKYTLQDINKLFFRVSFLFILLLFLLLVLITYFIIDSKKNRKVDLVQQKYTLENEYKQKEILNKFIKDIDTEVKQSFRNTETLIEKTTYQAIGYIQSKTFDNMPLIQKYLSQMETLYGVKFSIFKKSNLDIIYGKDSLKYIQHIIFNTKRDNKQKQQVTLQYIYSQGANNLQYWKNDLTKTIRLSFFDILKVDEVEYYIGSFSTINSSEQITKDVILKKIKDVKNYMIFYDLNKKEYNQSRFGNVTYSSQKYNFMIILNYDKNKLDEKTTNEIEIIKDEYELLLKTLIIYYMILSIVLFIVSYMISKIIKKIKISQDQLKKEVAKEVAKNREKDKILIQQSKLASMGEMLGNIAHQWRQPLNNISLILHFLKDNSKNLNEKELQKYHDKANKHIEYMSDTIDDFKNFYKPSKEKNKFNIKYSIQSLLEMLQRQFEKENIKLVFNSDDITILNYENELKQALLNILNNARDAILLKREKKAFNGLIKVTISISNDKVKILIFNNADTIKDEIIDKIFEPYFTTKFKTQGTGIGLYMTKSIIETNMGGKIEVYNLDDGVEFEIVLDIK